MQIDRKTKTHKKTERQGDQKKDKNTQTDRPPSSINLFLSHKMCRKLSSQKDRKTEWQKLKTQKDRKTKGPKQKHTNRQNALEHQPLLIP